VRIARQIAKGRVGFQDAPPMSSTASPAAHFCITER
jgi:hypothetical protein